MSVIRIPPGMKSRQEKIPENATKSEGETVWLGTEPRREGERSSLPLTTGRQHIGFVKIGKSDV